MREVAAVFATVVAVAATLALGAPATAAPAPCFGTADGDDPGWDAASGVYTPPPGATWTRRALEVPLFEDDAQTLGTRHYWRYVPAQPAAAGRRALVVVLHGGFTDFGIGEPPGTAGWGFNAIAARHGWVVVHPEGLYDPADLTCANGRLRHYWNDGRYYGPDQEPDIVRGSRVDDVGFLAAVLGEEIATAGVDPARVFVVGASNGGLMIHRLAAEPETAGRFAAVATNLAAIPAASAAAGDPLFAPLTPVPALFLTGDADELLPPGGGRVFAQTVRVGAFTETCIDEPVCGTGLPAVQPGLGYVTSRAATQVVYALANAVTALETSELADADGDGRTMTWSRAANVDRAADLELYAMAGGGHRNWGQQSATDAGPTCAGTTDCDETVCVTTQIGPSTQDVCWAELVGAFFRSHEARLFADGFGRGDTLAWPGRKAQRGGAGR